MKVMMNEGQVQFLLEQFTENDRVLEWGSGGSTLLFPSKVRSYVSVEHEVQWFLNVHYKVPTNVNHYFIPPNYEGIDPGVDNSDISDIMYQVLEKKYPSASDHQIKRYWQFRDYATFPTKLKDNNFTKVLIDGRARGMCAIKIADYLDKDAVIFIDDFYNRFEEYTDKFYTKFEPIGQYNFLGLFRVKQ